MNQVKPDEVSAILRKQLSGFESEADVFDVGTVLEVGDGIARVYGLAKVQAGELVVLPDSRDEMMSRFLEWFSILKKITSVSSFWRR